MAAFQPEDNKLGMPAGFHQPNRVLKRRVVVEYVCKRPTVVPHVFGEFVIGAHRRLIKSRDITSLYVVLALLIQGQNEHCATKHGSTFPFLPALACVSIKGSCLGPCSEHELPRAASDFGVERVGVLHVVGEALLGRVVGGLDGLLASAFADLDEAAVLGPDPGNVAQHAAETLDGPGHGGHAFQRFAEVDGGIEVDRHEVGDLVPGLVDGELAGRLFGLFLRHRAAMPFVVQALFAAAPECGGNRIHRGRGLRALSECRGA